MQINYRLVFLLLVAAIDVFWGIGSSPLMDPDEPAYAQTAKEMLMAGDYLSPRIFGDYWFDKPPMYYWLVIFSYKIFGVSEFAARFPAALCSVLTVGSLYYFVKRFFNENVALYSGLVLATCINFFYIGKASVTDMALLLFMSTSLYAYLDGKYYLFYLCAGLATLTKGPIGIVFPGAIIVLHMLFTRNFQPLKQKSTYLGWVVYFAVTVPWYVFMYQAHGSAFIDTFFGLHNAGRFSRPEHPGRVVWHYYIPVLIVGLMPWFNYFMGSVFSAFCAHGERLRSKLTFFQVWWIFVFIFFSVAQTKLVSYIFPLFPAVCVIIGWNIDRMSQKLEKGSRNFTMAMTIFFLGIFAAALFFAGWKIMPAVMPAAATIGVATVLTIVLVCYALFKGNVQAAFFTQAMLGMVIMFSLVNIALPQLSESFSVKNTALAYKITANEKPLYVDKFLRPGFAFYTDRYGTEVVDKRNLAFDTYAKDGAVFAELAKNGSEKGSQIVIRKTYFKRLSPAQQQKFDILYEGKENIILQFK